MSEIVRTEISKNRPHYIEKHRYLELKNFCLQYPIWKQSKASITVLSSKPIDDIFKSSGIKGDPTARCTEAIMFFDERIKMVEDAAYETDGLLGRYLIEGVTKGLSYTYLRTYMNIPCCRDTYYECYRRFFWILNKKRG